VLIICHGNTDRFDKEMLTPATPIQHYSTHYYYLSHESLAIVIMVSCNIWWYLCIFTIKKI